MSAQSAGLPRALLRGAVCSLLILCLCLGTASAGLLGRVNVYNNPEALPEAKAGLEALKQRLENQQDDSEAHKKRIESVEQFISLVKGLENAQKSLDEAGISLATAKSDAEQAQNALVSKAPKRLAPENQGSELEAVPGEQLDEAAKKSFEAAKQLQDAASAASAAASGLDTIASSVTDARNLAIAAQSSVAEAQSSIKEARELTAAAQSAVDATKQLSDTVDRTNTAAQSAVIAADTTAEATESAVKAATAAKEQTEKLADAVRSPVFEAQQMSIVAQHMAAAAQICAKAAQLLAVAAKNSVAVADKLPDADGSKARVNALAKAQSITSASQQAITAADRSVSAAQTAYLAAQSKVKALRDDASKPGFPPFVNGTEDGIFEAAFPEMTVINNFGGNFGSGAYTSVAFNAYQTNIRLWQKGSEQQMKDGAQQKKDDEQTKKDEQAEGMKYAFLPMYLFLKVNDTPPTKATLANDLLDNAYGGTANLKFSGGWKPDWFWSASQFKDFGASFIVDGGIKAVSVPLATPMQPSNPNLIGAAYLGAGFNFEFPAVEVIDAKDVTPGRNPAGTVAIGIGFYANRLDRGLIDPALFGPGFRNNYRTAVLSYEFQFSDWASLQGERILPTDKANPLGAYTSFGIKFNLE